MTRAPHPEAGFSLIEALAGMAILVLIAFFLLPLFSRSAMNNLSGRESTQVAKYGRDSQEGYSRAAFDSPNLTVDLGDEKRTDEAWVAEDSEGLRADGRWSVVTDPDVLPDGARWRRATTVRQYSLRDLNEDLPDEQALDEPLPAGTPDNFIHLKQVEVEVEGVRPESGIFGPNRRLVVTQLKAY